MRTIAILLLLPTSWACAANQQEATRSFDKSMPLGPGQRVSIEHRMGEVNVRGAAQKDVTIHATIRAAAGDQTASEKMVNEIEIQVEQNSSGVTIRTKYPEEGWLRGRRNLSYTVNYSVTIPETAPLEVRNAFGATLVSDVKGGARVVNSHGKLEFRNGKGTQTLENSFGAVEVAGNQGDATVTNGNGSVKVADVSGAVVVRSSFGSVAVERATGNVTVNNGNGSITVTDAGGEAAITGSFGTITVNGAGKGLRVTGSNGTVRAARVGGMANIRTSFGTVELKDATGGADVENANGAVKISGIKGSARVRTTFGGITIQDLAGPLDATNSNGSITVGVSAGGGCNPVVLRGTFGPIRVTLPETANYDVSASTSFGNVKTDFPIAVPGKVSSESVTGKIGQGGCELRVTNSNGGIELVKGTR